jgi:hypothetical protein
MKETSKHPDLEELTAFDGGRLQPEQMAAVERHVADCADCCRRLETLPEDAFAVLLRSFASGQTPVDHDTLLPSLPAGLVGHPRYRVVEVLGRGGMGVVWKAVQLLLDRVVALKVIHPELAGKPGFAERFRQEVRALGHLNHPNIAQAHDADRAGDALFLVMEHVAGTSLDRVVASRGPLPVGEAVEVARQTALALAHAHERGILHRDLKPHNILITPNGVVKVVDFGLAELVSEGEADSAGSIPLLGTPDYIAPEQAHDSRVADERSDLYSLGCTLYHLLAGQPPFPGGTVLQKLMRRQEEAPRPIAHLRPDVPKALGTFLGRLLERNPARRPSSAAEVAADLSNPLALVRTRPPMTKRRFLLMLTVFVLFVGGGGIAAVVWPRPDAEQALLEVEPATQPGPVEPTVARGLQQPLKLPAADRAPQLELKTSSYERALDWLRRNNRRGPDDALVRAVSQDIEKRAGKIDGFQLLVGEGMVKSGKPTFAVARFDSFVPFELSAAQVEALALKRSVVRFQPYAPGDEVRRASPSVRLSELHIERAEALPRSQRIKGTLRYTGLFSPGERPHVRVTVYLVHLKDRKTGSAPLRKSPLPASDRVVFQFAALSGLKLEKGPLVLFIELACWRDGRVVIESNTLPVLVAPLDEPPSGKGQ